MESLTRQISCNSKEMMGKVFLLLEVKFVVSYSFLYSLGCNINLNYIKQLISKNRVMLHMLLADG